MPSPDNRNAARAANPFPPDPNLCALCLGDKPVGVIPRGPCKGERACEDCLDGLEEDSQIRICEDFDEDNSGWYEAARLGLRGL
jgi:hypothetical protein